MKLDVSKWRDEDEYGFIQRAPADAIAWEFLRRNRVYQTEYARAEARGATRLWRDTLRKRWGLRFRRKA